LSSFRPLNCQVEKPLERNITKNLNERFSISNSMQMCLSRKSSTDYTLLTLIYFISIPCQATRKMRQNHERVLARVRVQMNLGVSQDLTLASSAETRNPCPHGTSVSSGSPGTHMSMWSEYTQHLRVLIQSKIYQMKRIQNYQLFPN
jgi:hypothetical protein